MKEYPIRDYTKFTMPKHEKKYVSHKFIGTVVTKDNSVVQGVRE